MKKKFLDDHRKHIVVLLAASVFMSFVGKAPYTRAEDSQSTNLQSENVQSDDAQIMCEPETLASENTKWVVSGGNGFNYDTPEDVKWYSAEKNGPLYLNIYGDGNIDFGANGNNRVDVESVSNNAGYRSFLINTDINETKDLIFAVGGKRYKVPVSIDNIPPKQEAFVVVSGNLPFEVTDHTGKTAERNTVSYNISDDLSDTMTIAVRDKISLTVSGVDVSDDKVPQSPVSASFNTADATNKLVLSTVSGQETVYKLDNILTTDEAGNVAQVGTGNTQIILDNQKPRIHYIEPKNYAYKEGNVYYYYGSIEGDAVKVTDRNLDLSSVSVNSVGDYASPELKASEPDADGTVTYTYSVKEKGRYQFSVSADDTLKNSIYDTTANDGATASPILSLDPSTVDELSIDFENEKGAKISKFAENSSEAKVYKSVKAKGYFITKDYNDVGIKVQGTGINGNSIADKDEKDSFKKKDPNSLMYEGGFDIGGTDGLYEVKSSGFKAKNFDNFFYIDNTDPIIDIDYDGKKPEKGSYHKDAVKATVTVKDLTFDKDETKISYGDDVKTAPEESDWKKVDENTYEKKITFDADGHYQIKVESTDRGGNTSKLDGQPDFYVDRTAPKINVSFDNDEAANGNYYKAARTATISIDEASFDPEKVEIMSLEGEDISPLPQNSEFSGAENIHRSTLKFEEDGTYGFKIKCTDSAGNESEEYTSDTFVIDTTAPTVSIDGVKDHSANKGSVVPTITYIDKNIDTEKTKVTYKGSNRGEIDQPVEMENIEGGVRYKFADLEHTKENDDLYKLSVKAVDLAGNETESEIRFSVNRFGSIFVVDDETAETIKNYYVNKPFPVKVMEINVDEIKKRDISKSLEDEITVLKENKDYQVEKEGGEDDWKSYTYTVYEDNFKHDGHYGVMIHSGDAAGNSQDNGAQGKEIDFAIDQTAPKIAVSDIEENGVYKEDDHVITVNAVDNMTVSGMSVCSGTKTLASYDGEELVSSNNIEKMRIPSSEKPQDIIIRAHDAAGNETVLTYSNVMINKNASGKGNGVTGKSEVLGTIASGVDSKTLLGAAAAGAAGCAAAVILAVRRKKITLETKND